METSGLRTKVILSYLVSRSGASQRLQETLSQETDKNNNNNGVGWGTLLCYRADVFSKYLLTFFGFVSFYTVNLLTEIFSLIIPCFHF